MKGRDDDQDEDTIRQLAAMNDTGAFERLATAVLLVEGDLPKCRDGNLRQYQFAEIWRRPKYRSSIPKARSR